MDYSSRAADWLMDMVFPVRCIGCGAFTRREYLCRSCRTAIPRKNGQECIGCERPSPHGMTCARCAKDNAVDQLLVAADYKIPLIQNALKLMKYQFIADIAPNLSILLNRFIRSLTKHSAQDIFSDNPLVVPVPLHPRRLRWRGFNQSELLATSLAQHFLLRMDASVISRVRQTTPQADIQEREQRLDNVSDVFSCAHPENIKEQTVLLIDDVCTTGATLNECARVLKANGAKKVIALVVARG